jgi:hypothetical protein
MMKGNEVNTAFEILLEEIELVANSLHEEGAAAFKAGDYDAARRAIEDATRLADFRDKVKALQKEWASLAAKRPQREVTTRRPGKSRLPRGLRTPEDAFRRPILEALVELGGTAPIGKVLDLVGEKKGCSDKVRSRAPSFGSPLHPLAQHSSVVPPYARARRLDEIGFASRHMGDLRIGTKVAAK